MAEGRERVCRVLTIVRTAAIGGIETYVIDFGGYLMNKEVEVTLATDLPRLSQLARAKGTLCIDLPAFAFADKASNIKLLPGFLRAAQRLAHHARSQDVTLVHVNASSTTVIMLGCAVSWLTSRPLVLTFHGSRTLRYPLFRMMARIGSSCCDGIVCVSQDTEGAVRKAVGKNATTRVIYNGTPEMALPKVERNLNTFAFVGRLSEEKAPMALVEAMPLILAERPNAHLAMIGEGPLEGAIRRRISDLGLVDSVQMEGWVTHEDLPDRLAMIGLLVMPSSTEGLPNLLLEAMLCETPVLATAVGGIPEAIDDNVTGFLLPNNGPDTIAAYVIRLLGSEGAREAGRRARERVLSDFNYARAYKEWQAFLSSLRG